MDGSERRQFPRFNLQVDVAVTRLDDLGANDPALKTRNVSRGGVCLISYEPLEASEIIHLEINLPAETESLKVNGRVAWVKEFSIGDDPKVGKRYDVGVEFIDVDEETLDILTNYLFTHIPQ
ncbi:MAG: PilZ domain-containing protein [Deltaproteobacteria bacterium]